MKQISLVGKSVKLVDSNNEKNSKNYKILVQLIAFFYPCFIIRDVLFFDKNNSVIFNGNNKYDLSQLTKEFIDVSCIHNSYDIDFTNRIEMLKFVYSKWGLDIYDTYSEENLSALIKMETWHFYSFLKRCWYLKPICLRWNQNMKLDFISLIGKDYNELVEVFEAIQDDYCYLIEKEMLGFIDTAKFKLLEHSSEDLHGFDVYEKFNEAFNDDYIAVTLSKYRCMKNDFKFRLIWLLSQFVF